MAGTLDEVIERASVNAGIRAATTNAESQVREGEAAAGDAAPAVAVAVAAAPAVEAAGERP